MTQSCHFLASLSKGTEVGTLRIFAKLHQIVVAFGAHPGLPGFDDAFGESAGAIGQCKIVINRDDAAETAAGGAGANGMVEAEQGRGRLAVFDVALGAVEAVGKELRAEG